MLHVEEMGAAYGIEAAMARRLLRNWQADVLEKGDEAGSLRRYFQDYADFERDEYSRRRADILGCDE